VKIEKGTAWQQLRSLCFDAIPAGATAYFTRALPLSEWRFNGSFQVVGCTKKLITLEAAGVEVGSALLADAEYLLDHAAEHHATVRDFMVETNWHSPAWAITTAYYWAFFSAMAITRLTGRTTWFLDRAAVSDFRKLANSTVQPGAGAMIFALKAYSTGITREIHLSPSRAQLHDSLWAIFHRLVDELYSAADQGANPLEYRLLWCIREAQLRISRDWPSRVRNLVNYRPGHAYREVIHDARIDAAPYVRRRSPMSFERVISSFEDQVLRVQSPDPLADTSLICRLLILFAITIAGIAEELHKDVVDRQSGDRRWLRLRQGFLQKHCSADDNIWPLDG